MDNRTIWQKMEDAYASWTELLVMLGWACVVGFLCWFMISTMIKEFLS